MKLTRIAVKLITYIYFFLRYRSHIVALVFAKNNVPIKTSAFVQRKGKNLHFNGNKNNVLPLRTLMSFNHPQVGDLVTLLNRHDIMLEQVADDHLVMRAGDISYRVVSGPNLAVLREIFSGNNYNILSGKECVLLDIGMNVGYASLYFSSFKNIKRVYGYEPFTDTFNIARQNITANASSSQKIIPNNYGISNYTGTIDVPLLSGGSVIASTDESFIRQKNIDSVNSISVKVRDILEVMKEVRENHPGDWLALKVDCEGEEYNILGSLDKNNGFDKVLFLCIEWHFRGPEPIKKILINNNFTVFEAHESSEGDFGMLYGFRNSNS